MTLDGTNTWVLREPGGSRSVVVDPGPPSPAHLDAVRAAAGDVAVVLLTHHHLDHSEAARAFAESVGCGVRALDPAYRLGSEGLGAGDVVAVDGLEVHVVATPGHTADSLSFVLPAERAVLTGDTVLGRGTTVVAHPDGSAGRLPRVAGPPARAGRAAHEIETIWPGHGPVIADALPALDHYLAHRQQRLDQVREALRSLHAAARDGVPLDHEQPAPPHRRDRVRRRRRGPLARRRALRPRPAGLPVRRARQRACNRVFVHLTSVRTHVKPYEQRGYMRYGAAQRARRWRRSTSMMTTERGSRRSQPRLAKSARALLTVSREAPTSWASSSWVRSWWTWTPSSAVRPKRSARSSRALATRPGTSEKTRSALTSLALRSRPAIWASRPRATVGRPSSHLQQVLVGERGERRVGDGGDGGRARAGVEQRELAEHLAGAEDGQQVLAAVAGGAAELHLAVEHDVEPVAGVALVEQHLAPTQLGLGHGAAQSVGRLVVERAEERGLTHHVVVHESSSDATRDHAHEPAAES